MANPTVLAGQRLPAGTLQKFGDGQTAYSSPIDASVTDPTVGAGENIGRYWRNGELCHAQVSIIFGAGMTAGSGTWSLPLPVNALATGLAQEMCGQGWIFDTSAATLYDCYVQRIAGDAANRGRLLYSPGVGVTSAAPMTWASGDTMILKLCYRADWP